MYKTTTNIEKQLEDMKVELLVKISELGSTVCAARTGITKAYFTNIKNGNKEISYNQVLQLYKLLVNG